MVRVGLVAAVGLVSLALPASAQGWNPFGDLHTTRAAQAARSAPLPQSRPVLAPASRSALAGPQIEQPKGPPVLDGGGRPAISPLPPSTVPFKGSYAPGQIVIDTAGRQLFLVQSGGTALRYPISVGREGFTWTGTQKISRVADWPDWRPPAEMRERDPRLPELMTGGVRNPLGAKALYLGNSLYRIHGTNDARTIGQAASSGCFRMLNGHVLDLANRVGVGTTVTVVSSLPKTVAGDAVDADGEPEQKPRRTTARSRTAG
jgi:lipoprotein-anchoring transpeptidase ErfK/SrfK